MPGTLRLRTFVRRGIVVAFLALMAGGVWLLLEGGRFLQHEDPLEHADAIVVLAGTRLEPAVRMIRACGIPFPLESEQQRDTLIRLGVPASAIMADDGFVDNTASEANLVRDLVIARHWHRVIVVTSKFHVRRAGFAFRRGLEGTGARPLMRASHYDPSDPANWWRTRADVRFGLSEWGKLVLYWLGLGA